MRMDLTHPTPKLCQLSKWPHFEGYGFDLMTKKNGDGHYISMIHEGGPAEATHLEAGDWLIEVNGVNVEDKSHSQVITLIKESQQSQVNLLLIPPETERWRKRNRIAITSSYSDLMHYSTPIYQGKLRLFINGAIDKLNKINAGVVGGGRRNDDTDEYSVYHRYSLPMPSSMEDRVASNPVWLERSGSNGQVVGQSPVQTGPLDEERQKQITAWRDKSLEMLMAAGSIDGDEDGDHHDDDDEDYTYRGSFVAEDEKDDTVVTSRPGLLSPSSQHITTITIMDGEYFARMCKISKWPGCSDYGFKLDSLVGQGGHFLRSIDPKGPAGLSGVKENDRIIEVNNVNVEYSNHGNLVKMILNSPDNEVTMLVVDQEAYNWFQSRNIRIHHGARSLIRYCDRNGMRQGSFSVEHDHQVKQHDDEVNAIADDNGTLKLDHNHHDSSKLADEIPESPSSSSDWSYYGNELNRLSRIKIIEMPADAPKPRLCSIRKNADERFGFTMNTYQRDGVKLVAEVEQGSPAWSAGILQWDRVVEVNGVNVNTENHSQVKARIGASGDALYLLVLQEDQYEWYQKKGLVPKSNQSNVIHLSNSDVTKAPVQSSDSIVATSNGFEENVYRPIDDQQTKEASSKDDDDNIVVVDHYEQPRQHQDNQEAVNTESRKSKTKSLSRKLVKYRNSFWSRGSSKDKGSMSNVSLNSEKINGKQLLVEDNQQGDSESIDGLQSHFNKIQEAKVEKQSEEVDTSEGALLDKLKTLSARDLRTARAEGKIQAYLRMSSLDFGERIKYFEDL